MPLPSPFTLSNVLVFPMAIDLPNRQPFLLPPAVDEPLTREQLRSLSPASERALKELGISKKELVYKPFESFALPGLPELVQVPVITIAHVLSSQSMHADSTKLFCVGNHTHRRSGSKKMSAAGSFWWLKLKNAEPTCSNGAFRCGGIYTPRTHRGTRTSW